MHLSSELAHESLWPDKALILAWDTQAMFLLSLPGATTENFHSLKCYSKLHGYSFWHYSCIVCCVSVWAVKSAPLLCLHSHFCTKQLYSRYWRLRSQLLFWTGLWIHLHASARHLKEINSSCLIIWLYFWGPLLVRCVPQPLTESGRVPSPDNGCSARWPICSFN